MLLLLTDAWQMFYSHFAWIALYVSRQRIVYVSCVLCVFVCLSVKAKIFPRPVMYFSLILSAWQKECQQLVLISNAMIKLHGVMI